jgi:4-amino-4-deoxy-L-arabinose transferase-like glycosyltransferase
VSPRRRLARALLALLATLPGIVLLLLPGLRVPGHRGGLLLADGFRPGRWDARFVVARGPAEIRLPPEAGGARVSLLLSGPARVRLKDAGGERTLSLGAQPERVPVDRRAGAAVRLEPDAAVRLHEVQLERAGPHSGRDLGTLLAAGLAGAAVAALLPVRGAIALGAALPLVATLLLLRGTLAGLFGAVLVQRLAPGVLVLLLAGAPLLLLLLPRGPAAPAAPRVPAGFALLLLASCVLQLVLYEQPVVAGDPAAYHDIAGRFRDALLAVRTPDDLADAVQTLRPYGGLALLGTVYGALRALRDDPSTLYLAHALALAGCAFFLVRAALRLGGTRLGVVTGMLALSYGTFPVLAGTVQPEPLLLLAWTFALDALLAALETHDARRAALAGLAFGVGLALHPQGLWFLLAAFALVLLPFASTLRAPPARHRIVRAFLLGLVPVLSWTAIGEAYARPVTPVLDERHGFWAYTASLPLGFWLFLETDGWQGPMRLDETRYGRALREAEQQGGASSGPLRLAFTLRFVAANTAESLRTVLRNLHRLFHVPDNPPRRDFPLPFPLQLLWHRALVLLFLLALPLAAGGGRAALLYVPFAMLAATYPLYHVFNKYAVPATPFVLLGAALALVKLGSELRSSLPLLPALALAAAGAALPPATLAFAGVPPLLARFALLALYLLGLAWAFHFVSRRWAADRRGRVLAAIGLLLLALPAVAARTGDPSWRRFERTLERPAEHEIELAPDELALLNDAREAYLVLELRLPDGDPAPLSLRFGSGLVLGAAELQPTMPAFGIATTRFQRDPKSFAQWWRVSWRPEMAGPGGVRLTLQGSAAQRLAGSLDDGAGALDFDLSLGQWPYASVYRLQHDGEYRLPVTQPLGGRARRSRYAGEPLPGTWRVRLVALADDSLARVVTPPVPEAARAVVTSLWGRTSKVGRIALETPGGDAVFRLEERAPIRLAGGEARFAATGEAEGWLLLRISGAPAEPLRLTLRPYQEMAWPPRFFLPELRGSPPLPLDWTGVPYLPVTRIEEARALPWRPKAVF